MYLTGLADVVRAAGLEVTEVPGWLEHGRGPFAGLETIVCHHTAGPSAAADPRDFPSFGIVRNGRPGLQGPLSNLGLGRSGRVYVFAAGKANHAGRVTLAKYANAYAIGIEAENNGTGEAWPTVQRTAYARLCAALVDAAASGDLIPGKRFPLTPDDVRAHREVCDPPGRKIDPTGIIMNPFREAVRRSLVDLRASRDAPRPKPPTAPPFPLPAGSYFGPKEGPDESVSGYYSHALDLKRWQERMIARGWKLKATGRYDAQTAKVAAAFRAEKHLEPGGGRIGPRLWAAAWTAPVTR